LNKDNPDYVEENLTESTFTNLDLSFIVLIDNKNSILYKKYYSVENEEFIEFPSDFFVDFDSLINYSDLEDDIKPVDDTQIGDTIIEESVNDENTTEDTTTSEEGQTSDNTDETIIETETTEN